MKLFRAETLANGAQHSLPPGATRCRKEHRAPLHLLDAECLDKKVCCSSGRGQPMAGARQRAASPGETPPSAPVGEEPEKPRARGISPRARFVQRALAVDAVTYLSCEGRMETTRRGEESRQHRRLCACRG